MKIYSFFDVLSPRYIGNFDPMIRTCQRRTGQNPWLDYSYCFLNVLFLNEKNPSKTDRPKIMA